MLSSALAPHEHRERWVTTIAGSFPRIVIWRAARKKYVETVLTIKKLKTHLSKTSKDLNDLWLGSAVLDQCQKLQHTLGSLENGYIAAMSWLEGSQIIDGAKSSNWQNSACRPQRSFIIKQMAVFHGRCEQVTDLVEYLIEQTKLDPNYSLQSPSAFHQEIRLRDVQDRASWILNEALDTLRQRYNTGQLFAEYARNILDDIAIEKAMYTRRRRDYPYPVPRLIVSDDQQSDFWRNFGPLEDMPRLEDDEHAEWLLF